MKTKLPRLTLSLLICGASALSAFAATTVVTSDGPKHLEEQWQNEWINVEPVWKSGRTGTGVVIGVFGQFLDWSHPAIADVYNAALSKDYFTTEETEPDKMYTDEPGGVFFGGLAAGGGEIKGIAYGAQLAGYHVLSGGNSQVNAEGVFDALTTFTGLKNFVQADGIYESATYVSAPQTRIFICPWLGDDQNYEQDNYKELASVRSLYSLVSKNNVILVTNAGDLRSQSDDFSVNTTAQLNGDCLVNPDTIYVAATNKNGVYSPQSDWGSAVFVSAPGDNVFSAGRSEGSSSSSSSSGSSSSTKANSSGVIESYGFAAKYDLNQATQNATAVVAGVLALGAQGNPAMDVRWAKHALARSATVLPTMQPEDYTGWVTNAAGLSFSNDYGFGMVNAEDFVKAVDDIAYVTIEGTSSVVLANSKNFNYNSSTKTLSQTISKKVTTADALESVEVTVNLSNVNILGAANSAGIPTKGTTITLTHINENGHETTSVLMSPSYTGVGTVQEAWAWTFVSNAFWGESAKGTWSLNISYLDDFGSTVDWTAASIGATSLTFHTGTVAMESGVTGVSNSKTLEVRSFAWDSAKTFTIASGATMNVQDVFVVNSGVLAVNGTLGAIEMSGVGGKSAAGYLNGGAISLGANGTITTPGGLTINGGTLSVGSGSTISGGITLNSGAINVGGTSNSMSLGTVTMNGGSLNVARTAGTSLANLSIALTMKGGSTTIENTMVSGTMVVNGGSLSVAGGTVKASSLTAGYQDNWSTVSKTLVTGYDEDGNEIESSVTYDVATAPSTAGAITVGSGVTLDGGLTATGAVITKNILTETVTADGTVYGTEEASYEYRPRLSVSGKVTGQVGANYADVYLNDGAELTGNLLANNHATLTFAGTVKSAAVTTAATSTINFRNGLMLTTGNSTISSNGTFNIDGTATIKTNAATAVSFAGTYNYTIGSLLTVQALTPAASPAVSFADLDIAMDVSYEGGVLPQDEISFIRVLNAAGTPVSGGLVVDSSSVTVSIGNAPQLYVGGGTEVALEYEIDTTTGNLASTAAVSITPLRLTYSAYTDEQKAILKGLRTCLAGEPNAGMSSDLIAVFDGDATLGISPMTLVSEVTAGLDQLLPVNLKTIATLHNKQANATVGVVERRSRELRAGAPVNDVWAQPLFSSYGFSYSVNPNLLASTSFRQFDLINYTTPYMVWANGGYAFSDGKKVKHTGKTETRMLNAAFGIDYGVTDTLSMGVFVAYLEGATKLETTSSKTEAQMRTIGVYAAGSTTDNIGSTYYSAMLSYGMADYEMKRNTRIGSYSSTAKGDPDGSQIVANLSAGYEWDAGSHALSYQWTTGPSIALRYVYNMVDGYSEKGSGIDALKTDDFDYSSLLLTLAWRTTARFDLDSFCTIVPEFRVSYNHEFIDNGDIDVSFVAASDARYSTDLNHEGQDYVSVGFGNTFMLTDHFTVSVDYDCTFARQDSEPEHSFNVMARARF